MWLDRLRQRGARSLYAGVARILQHCGSACPGGAGSDLDGAAFPDAPHHRQRESAGDGNAVANGAILTRVQILLDDTQPKIASMVNDASHMVYLARGQAQKVDRVFTEAADRMRGQLIHMDRILSAALESVEEAGLSFKHSFW